eukprot:scaffold410531_cov33-Prasinocladus_malaysianus.AAC.1
MLPRLSEEVSRPPPDPVAAEAEAETGLAELLARLAGPRLLRLRAVPATLYLLRLTSSVMVNP